MQLSATPLVAAFSLLSGLILISCSSPIPYNPPYNDFRPYRVGSYALSAGKLKDRLLDDLFDQGVQVVTYGNLLTVIMPTDMFFVFDTAELDDIQHEALNNIVRLLQNYPYAVFNIAGFTDDVGSWKHKKNLSLRRAQMVRTFLWAHGIDLCRLTVRGFGDHMDVASNNWALGSTWNRRVEIQWRF